MAKVRKRMTRARKAEALRKEGRSYIKPPEEQRKVPYVYSPAFQRWFERVRAS